MTDPNAPGVRSKIAENDTRVSALLGVRQIVARSVVDVSLLAGVFVAHESLSGTTLRPGESVSSPPGSSDNSLGETVGFAEERELIPNHAVRLSVDLATVNTVWSRLAAFDSDGNIVHTDSRGWERGVRARSRALLAVLLLLPRHGNALCSSVMDSVRTLIVGAGISGLATAAALADGDYLVLEADDADRWVLQDHPEGWVHLGLLGALLPTSSGRRSKRGSGPGWATRKCAR